jgi:hypothetical protein
MLKQQQAAGAAGDGSAAMWCRALHALCGARDVCRELLACAVRHLSVSHSCVEFCHINACTAHTCLTAAMSQQR